MTRHLHIEPVDLATKQVRVWRPHLDYAGEPMRPGEFRDPPVDIHELFAENIQREDGRHSRLSSLRDRAASRLAALRFNPARIISGDCFFLITGAMVALDLVLVIALVRR